MPNAPTPINRPHPKEVPEASILMRFADEDDPEVAWAPAAASAPRMLGWGALGVVVIVAAVAAGMAIRRPVAPADTAVVPSETSGTLLVSARPEGAQVLVDGVDSGVTPLRLALPVGDHVVELRNGESRRSLPVTIEAAVVASHYVDLAPTVAVANGRLDVTSTPPGSRVSIDGTVRGTTPLSLPDLAPGTHRVVVTNGDLRAVRTVSIVAGGAARIGVTLAPAPAETTGVGWVAILSPIELRVLVDGRFIGTTTSPQLPLPPGRHQLQLTQPALGYESRIDVDVTTAQVTTTTVALPTGTVSLNALPWAEVTIDGRAVGTTPLANLAVPIGPHQVVFSHPQFGERRQSISVTSATPVRLGIDFNK